MKARFPVTLSLAAALVSAAAIFFLQTSSAQETALPQTPVSSARPMSTVNDLATPLLHRDFTSSCVAGEDGYYKETLSFAADARTTFVRHYYADAECTQLSPRSSVQQGRYALAEEESGQLLLIVRNLYDEKSAALTPYFEALMKVDQDQLVMQSSPSTSLHYTAQLNSI